ncbi:MAG: MFS transporter [Dehalococcoidia bacterium]
MQKITFWRTTFSSLENHNFRWFWFSATATAAVLQMNLVARGLLVWELTGSYADVGLVSFAAGICMFLFSSFGGAIADRLDKRNLLIATQVFTSAILLWVAILILLDIIEVWHLVIAAVGNGTMMAFNLPARQSAVPQLVEQNQVMNAVALNAGSQNLNRVLAPGVGGLVIGLLGFAEAYFLMTALAVFSAVFMMFVRPVGVSSLDSRPSVMSNVVEGIKYVRRTPVLGSLLMLLLVPVALGMPYMMQLAAFASDVLEASEVRVGVLYSATGIGALIGSILIATMGDYKRKGNLLLGTGVMFGIFLVLLSFSSAFYVPFFVLIGVGMANAVYLIANNTLLLTSAEDQMRGRVMGLSATIIAFYPMSVWPLGEAMDRVDPRLVFAACGGLIGLIFFAVVLLRPHMRKL